MTDMERIRFELDVLDQKLALARWRQQNLVRKLFKASDWGDRAHRHDEAAEVQPVPGHGSSVGALPVMQVRRGDLRLTREVLPVRPQPALRRDLAGFDVGEAVEGIATGIAISAFFAGFVSLILSYL